MPTNVNDMDDLEPYWKALTAATAVLGMIGRGLYTSGKKYSTILDGIDDNSRLINEVIEQQKVLGKRVEDQSKILHKHETRLAVVESKLG